MLKGHVFSKQIFENPIFALFIDTFLNGTNGISNNYKNAMKITSAGSNITIDSGAVCIQGRFLEEDTSTTLSAGTDNSYCKLVIEINLDKQNTESNFAQGSYKIIKSATGFPNLTQNNIVKNNSGIYQYELARFRTSSNGIVELQDKRTYLDFTSIYKQIKQHIDDIDNGAIYLPKSNISVITGNLDTGQAIIELTNGFTSDNCVIISMMFQNPNDTNKNWGVGSTFDSGSYLTGSVPVRAYMRNNKIVVQAKNIQLRKNEPVSVENGPNYLFKIVLLKIS